MAIWPTMFDETCRQRMLDRLRRLDPEAHRNWGRMSAPQMVAHLTDQMRHCLGDVPVEARPGLLRLPPVRLAAIYVIPWPKGRITGPPEAFVSKPAAWGEDVEHLAAMIERFAACDPDGAWPAHALFGTMRGRDWGVFVHKHFDHHLRQFGA